MVARAAEDGVKISKEWKDYRQALRDVSKQASFPQNVIWPTPPAVAAS